jgi:hypothetical protein
MTPLHNLAAVDVPGQVDEQIACGNVLCEKRPEILGFDAILDERHALREPGTERRLVWLKVHDGDTLRRDLHVLEENGQRASRHRTKSNKENALVELEHESPPHFGKCLERLRDDIDSNYRPFAM